MVRVCRSRGCSAESCTLTSPLYFTGMEVGSNDGAR